ncbi:alpha/beta hydrolase [Hyalangium sp.]|uniref:alpha/beta fold hydrolase n=1 Tax=Hyalangium sp. TaxID=2028555 RepID=UPI002D5D4E4B|nr:alpha/beta hydrolase [Hyalangium sp.]HYH97800.1 alpha/beta hydrolase [Hyalangium sp.]
MPLVELRGQIIHYEDSGGPGRPLILGHEFLLDSRMFDPQVLVLSPEFRVIRWDARALGRTQWDGKPFSLWDSAEDCIALMDYLGIEQAVVGGLSLGGHCALRAALLYPERVKALVLMGTRATREDAQQRDIYMDMAKIWSSEGPIEPLLHILASSLFGEPQRFKHWFGRWRMLTGAHFLASSRCLVERDDISKHLKDIHCPSITFHGLEDLSVAPSQGELLHLMLPGSTGFVPIPGAAHAANLTHPEILTPPLLEFLRAHA